MHGGWMSGMMASGYRPNAGQRAADDTVAEVVVGSMAAADKDYRQLAAARHRAGRLARCCADEQNCTGPLSFAAIGPMILSALAR